MQKYLKYTDIYYIKTVMLNLFQHLANNKTLKRVQGDTMLKKCTTLSIMYKFYVLFFIITLSINQCFAYLVKLYDQYGKHIGNARKNGEQYEFYNLNDEKVENYEDLFETSDDKRTITEYSKIIYDQNLRPIGSFTDGIYGNIGPIDTFGTFRYYGHPVYGYPRIKSQPIIILPEYKFRKDGTIRGNIKY